jgi:hypothetical protein
MKRMFDKAKQTSSSAADKTKSVASDTLDSLQSASSTLTNKTKAGANSLGKSMDSAHKDTLKTMDRGAKQAAKQSDKLNSGVKKNIGGTRDTVTGGINDAFKMVGKVGKKASDGFKSAVDQGKKALK